MAWPNSSILPGSVIYPVIPSTTASVDYEILDNALVLVASRVLDALVNDPPSPQGVSRPLDLEKVVEALEQLKEVNSFS